MAHYYISENGVRRGPFELHQLAGEGIRPDSLVWCEGMDSWQRADSVSELAQVFYSPTYNGAAQHYQQYSTTAPNSGYDPYYPPTQQYYSQPYYNAQGGPGLGIASMVLGIVSICIFCVWFLSIPCALVGIILGFVALKNQPAKPYAVAGIICSFCSIAVLVAFFALIVLAGRH